MTKYSELEGMDESDYRQLAGHFGYSELRHTELLVKSDKMALKAAAQEGRSNPNAIWLRNFRAAQAELSSRHS